MRRSLVAALLFAAACEPGESDSPAAPETPPSSEAQAWLDAHNAGRGTRGENIAANAPPGSLDLAGVVNAWASEAQYYDYSRNTCASGQQCGHYTQIVWRDTLRVGCAHRTCQSNSPFGPGAPAWDFWVCDYEPPGN